jgi:hypothetical protein
MLQCASKMNLRSPPTAVNISISLLSTARATPSAFFAAAGRTARGQKMPCENTLTATSAIQASHRGVRPATIPLFRHWFGSWEERSCAPFAISSQFPVFHSANYRPRTHCFIREHYRCHGSHAQICIFQTSRYSRFEETCTTESALRSEHYRQSGLRHLRQLGPSLDCGGRNAARMHAAGLTKSPTLASLICCSASRHERVSLQRSSWCTTGTRR